MSSPLFSRIPTWDEPADAELFPDDSEPTAFERVAAARGVKAPKVHRSGRPTLTVVSESVDEESQRPAHRPVKFSEVIGQGAVTMRLETHLRAAHARGDQPGHILLAGPPGTGKTTLALALATELDALGVPSTMHELTADSIVNARQLALELAKLTPGDILYLDEAQALKGSAQTAFLRVLEDSIMFVPGSAKAPAIKFTVPAFTLVASTSNPGKLSTALRSRFRLTAHLERYDVDDLGLLGLEYCERAGIKLDTDAALVLAGAARGVPRRMLALIGSATDYSYEVTGCLDALLCADTAKQSLEYADIDERGLERRDRRYLETLCLQFDGGPVGQATLAGVLGFDLAELATDIEPYLIESGLLDRRSTGRCATAESYRALGLRVPPVVCGYR